MYRPISKINTYISNVHEVCNTFVIIYQYFEILSWDMTRSMHWQAIIFLITSLNSTLENGDHSEQGLAGTLLSNCELIWWFWAELNILWSACQRSSSLIYSCLLYWRTLIANKLYFLIQFIKSQDFLFFEAISWIFSSKNNYFVWCYTYCSTTI